MLEIINKVQSIETILLDDLWLCAKQRGMSINIDSNHWRSSMIQVELKCENEAGSSFKFIGTSKTSVKEAFLIAFKEAEVIGKGYV